MSEMGSFTTEASGASAIQYALESDRSIVAIVPATTSSANLSRIVARHVGSMTFFTTYLSSRRPTCVPISRLKWLHFVQLAKGGGLATRNVHAPIFSGEERVGSTTRKIPFDGREISSFRIRKISAL
jgi:hypothetical protein